MLELKEQLFFGKLLLMFLFAVAADAVCISPVKCWLLSLLLLMAYVFLSAGCF